LRARYSIAIPKAFLTRPTLAALASFADIGVRHAYQTIVIGGASVQTADLLKIALGAPTAECRCVVIDESGIAIYVADITYRSEVHQAAHRPACPCNPFSGPATVATPRAQQWRQRRGERIPRPHPGLSNMRKSR